MMDIKWIKLKVGMFNDDKIKVIQAMPEGDSLLVIWIRLLILAGTSNADGYLMISENIPYTEEMLAVIFGKPVSVIRLALKTFETFGMLDNDREGIFITCFSAEQGERIQDIREYNRQKKAESRERAKQKLVDKKASGQEKGLDAQQQDDLDEPHSWKATVNVNYAPEEPQEPDVREEPDWEDAGAQTLVCQEMVNDISIDKSLTCQRCQTTDKEKELEKELEKEKHYQDIINNISPGPNESGPGAERIDYSKIVEMYNLICRDLPKVRGISDERRRKVKTLLNSLNKAKVLMDLDPYARMEFIFRRADESDFLSGRGQPNSWCGFDWLINTKNALKTIEGNYKNPKGGMTGCGSGRGGIQQADAGYSDESEKEALAIFQERRKHPPDGTTV